MGRGGEGHGGQKKKKIAGLLQLHFSRVKVAWPNFGASGDQIN